MREIKFRAWNKNKNEMELLDSFFELQKMNLTRDELKDRVFMQFTGLRDKNGKEIYEGDIVIHPDFGNNPLIISIMHGCTFMAGWDCIRTDATESIIIGNIHENPELVVVENA